MTVPEQQMLIESNENNEFLKLNEIALNALNLIDKAGNNPPNSSLYSLLNKCNTKQGSRLLLQWIKKPLLNLKEIQKRQNLVKILYDCVELRQLLLSVHLKGIVDIESLMKKLSSSKGQLKECVLLYDFSKRVLEFKDGLEEFCMSGNAGTEEFKEFLTVLKTCDENLGKFKELIETTVDLDSSAENQEYFIKACFDEELSAFKAQMEEAEKEIHKIASAVSDEIGLALDKKLKLDKNSPYGYHLRVSRLDSHSLKKISGGLTELSTQKSGVLFTTKKLKKATDKFDAAHDCYQKKQKELVDEIVTITAGYFPVFEELDWLYSFLDVLTSFSHVASSCNYCQPKMFDLGGGDMILRDSRHPCMELQEGIDFIKNDVEMRREESSFFIITGANMGGKSTYLRQVGMIVVMAQIGSFVPCSEASIPLFDSILCRVGAGDKPLKGISTFMAEMMDTSEIINEATSNSLVLIDELGRGTSTFDGFGLAWSISKHLSSVTKCFGLFATHFHELTYLADEVQSVKNFHVSVLAKENEIVLLYKVIPGRNDQSFGLHVAKLADFPEEVIDLAKLKVDELNEDLSVEEDALIDQAMMRFSNVDLSNWANATGPDFSNDDLNLLTQLKDIFIV